MQELLKDLSRIQPELALSAGLLLVVLVDATGVRGRDAVNRLLSALSLAAALYLCGPLTGQQASGPIFSGMLAQDPMGGFFKVVLIAASLLVLLAFTFTNSREL